MLSKLWLYEKRYGWRKTLLVTLRTLWRMTTAFWHHFLLCRRYQDHHHLMKSLDRETNHQGVSFADAPWSSLTHERIHQHCVLFVQPPYPLISTYYRVEHIREYLAGAGFHSEVIPSSLLTRSEALLSHFSICIVFRCALSVEQREWLTRQTKKYDVQIIASFDDLIFDEHLIATSARLPISFTTRERVVYQEEARKYAALILVSNSFLSSTHALAQSAGVFAKPTFVIHNGFSKQQCAQADKARTQKIQNKKIVTIGYFSGTHTHDIDFQQIEPILLRLLKKYPHLYLTIVGYLTPSARFSPFQDRIRHSGSVPWKKLPFAMATCDIAIAPLEMDNPIVQAKSAAKYSEAGLVQIPIVASPISSFTEVIRSGWNGFLAHTQEQWYNHLSTLIEDEQLREDMGKHAFEHVISTFGPENMIQETKCVFETMVARRRTPVA